MRKLKNNELSHKKEIAMDYWERKDRKTQLTDLNKRNRQNFAGGGSVKEVTPGVFANIAPGEKVTYDKDGNPLFVPPTHKPSAPIPSDPQYSDDI
jgi:hypothetical protein